MFGTAETKKPHIVVNCHERRVFHNANKGMEKLLRAIMRACISKACRDDQCCGQTKTARDGRQAD